MSQSFPTRAVLALAGIFSFRMLGLFIILPIFALYAQKLPHATPALIGLAMGIYGLTQAIFQIPLAMWSDKIGRKPIIIGGLLLFALGSVVAAFSHSIYWVIFGRAVQGAGAVGSTIIALVADLTTTEQRSKAMAVVGISIGISFGVAMILGPALNTWVGLAGVFWFTALLAISGIALCAFSIPHPPRATFHKDAEPLPALFKSALQNPALLRLDFGIFALHALFTASFIVIPLLLKHMGFPEARTWMMYLPGLLFAWITVMPSVRLGEQKNKMHVLFLVAIILLGISQFCFWFFASRPLQMGFILTLFFTAFTFLETTLPSWVSKVAPAGSKGTAIGIYSTSQFLGIFIGGSVGGWLYSHFQMAGIFMLGIALCFLWLIVAKKS